MTTESNEQYRVGFEAWARKNGYENLGGEYGGPGNIGWWYWSDETAAAWDGWEAAKREASTEPSAGRAPFGWVTPAHDRIILASWYKPGEVPPVEGMKPVFLAEDLPASALTDDAKDAAMWRALVSDTEARPCAYPCLRDDLADWIAAHTRQAS